MTSDSPNMRSLKDRLRGTFSMHTVCPHCGATLKRKMVTICKKQIEVTCYGSCGCEESSLDGTEVMPSEREWVKAGIPKHYLKANCDVSDMIAAVESGRSVYIHGPYGVGKTYAACSLAKALVNRGSTVRFENSRHIMTEIQGMYSGNKSDALNRAYACKVLILDDLGKEQATPFAISMLYELIDSRYMDGKPIVVTSNFSRPELLKRLCPHDAATAESIVSRLCENAETVYMCGDDRRLA